jgi:hypothetical protein
MDMIMDDELHCMALGVEQRYVGQVFARALRTNVFACVSTTIEDLLAYGSLALASELKPYYRNEAKLNPHRKLSRVDKFHHNMLGKDLDRPCLKAKGGETMDLVKYAVSLAKQHSADDDDMLLFVNAGNALLGIREIFRKYPRKLPDDIIINLFSLGKRHVTTMIAAGCHSVPKHHQFMHMLFDSKRNGNPKSYSAWYDEHENGVLARMCVRLHVVTFNTSVFERLLLQEFLLDQRAIIEE